MAHVLARSIGTDAFSPTATPHPAHVAHMVSDRLMIANGKVTQMAIMTILLELLYADISHEDWRSCSSSQHRLS